MSLEPWVSQGTPTNFFNRETELLQEMLSRLRNIPTSTGTLVDLGPGAPSSVARRAVAIAQAIHAVKYIPVDISDAFLATAVEVFRRELPTVLVEPMHADFFDENFSLNGAASFIYFGGSTISNLPVSNTTAFPELDYARYLKKLSSLLSRDGHILIGWHAAADEGYALAPYTGAEARYYLETPLRVLTQFGALGFTVDEWKPESIWHAASQCVSHGLRARHDVKVNYAGHTFSFLRGERLEITPSYKIQVDTMNALINRVGLRVLDKLGRPGGYSLWLIARPK